MATKDKMTTLPSVGDLSSAMDAVHELGGHWELVALDYPHALGGVVFAWAGCQSIALYLWENADRQPAVSVQWESVPKHHRRQGRKTGMLRTATGQDVMEGASFPYHWRVDDHEEPRPAVPLPRWSAFVQIGPGGLQRPLYMAETARAVLSIALRDVREALAADINSVNRLAGAPDQ
jgi:hypothetical protein